MHSEHDGDHVLAEGVPVTSSVSRMQAGTAPMPVSWARLATAYTHFLEQIDEDHHPRAKRIPITLRDRKPPSSHHQACTGTPIRSIG